MTVNGVLSFFFCMIEVVFIRPANPKEAPNTYVLRNGVANISFEIDKKAVDGYYVDVFNPRKKKIFQCLGTNPENVSLEFKEKVQLSGDYKIGTISFSVLNATDEDAGMYTSVIEMRGEQVGSQLLVVFEQFPTPKISTTKTANHREESSQTFTCQVETNGTPPGYYIPVSYKWKRNGLPVNHSDKYGIQNSALIIKYLQRSDLTDSFTCLAQNDYGAKSPESNALTIAQYSMQPGSCGMSCINGICNDVRGEIKCNCNHGWTGFNCSIDIDECSSNPCHSGTCYNFKYGEYLCVCTPGWTGKQCELDIDECVGSLCANGGNCKDLANDYMCHCASGWTGKNCEIAINDCFAEPCVSGSCHVKLNSTNGYYCVCKDGWIGTNCSIYASGNLPSLTAYIAGVVGAVCIITVVILFIFVISYRRLITSMHVVSISPVKSSEDAV